MILRQKSHLHLHLAHSPQDNSQCPFILHHFAYQRQKLFLFNKKVTPHIWIVEPIIGGERHHAEENQDQQGMHRLGTELYGFGLREHLLQHYQQGTPHEKG